MKSVELTNVASVGGVNVSFISLKRLLIFTAVILFLTILAISFSV